MFNNLTKCIGSCILLYIETIATTTKGAKMLVIHLAKRSSAKILDHEYEPSMGACGSCELDGDVLMWISKGETKRGISIKIFTKDFETITGLIDRQTYATIAGLI